MVDINNCLFTENQFSIAKSRDLLPLKCVTCGKVYYRTKHAILSNIKNKNKNVYCSMECRKKYYKNNLILDVFYCDLCGKKIFRTKRNRVSKHHFCSLSCSAKYNNTHKTNGYRRSKLEIYLETKLTELFTDLEILYNDRNILPSGHELDIYIPELKLAFELNGPVHYIPIFGQEKFKLIQENDYNKLIACQKMKIVMCIVDTSNQKHFTEKSSEKYLNMIIDIINNGRATRS